MSAGDRNRSASSLARDAWTTRKGRAPQQCASSKSDTLLAAMPIGARQVLVISAKCRYFSAVQNVAIGPSRQAAFFGPTSLTGHCGHGWTCSLPRPVAIDP